MKNLKSIPKVILLILILNGNLLIGQASHSCSTATELTLETFTSSTLDAQVGWYKFEATSSDFYLTLVNEPVATDFKINKIKLYDGLCSGVLTLVAGDSLSDVLSLSTNSLTDQHTYYIKIFRNETSASESSFYITARTQTLQCGIEWWFHGPGGIYNPTSTSPTLASSGLYFCDDTYSVSFNYLLLGMAPTNTFNVMVSTNLPTSYSLSTTTSSILTVPFSSTSAVTPVIYTMCVRETTTSSPCQCLTFTLNPKPNPNFTISPNPVCAGGTICASPNAPTGIGILNTWILSNTPNSFTTNANSPCLTTVAGNYTLFHGISNPSYLPFGNNIDAACYTSTTTTGSLTPVQAGFSYTSSCSFSVAFTATPTCKGLSPTYIWNFGHTLSIGAPSPIVMTTNSVITHAFPTASVPVVYTVQLTVINSGTWSAISQTVLVVGYPNATIIGPAGLCGTVTTGSYWITANQSVTAASWSSTGNTVSATGNPANVNITFANTATTNVISATYTTANGCTGSVSYTVRPCCPILQGTQLLGNNVYSTPGPLTYSGNVVVTGTVVVSASSVLEFDQATVYMSPGSRIQVNGTGTLLVTDSHIRGCDYMWDGLYLMNNSALEFENVYVSDAQRVIVDTLGAHHMDLDNFIFFKNYKGICLKSSTNTSSLTAEQGIITSASVTVAFPITLAYNTSSTTIGGYSKSLLAIPYNNKYASIGVELLNTKSTYTLSGVDDYRIPLKEILFDKLDWGVYVRGSHVSVTSCNFQYSSLPTNVTKFSPWPKTGGVYVGYPIVEGEYDWYSGHVNDVRIGGNTPRQCSFLQNIYGVLSEAPCRLVVDQNNFNEHCYSVYMSDNWTNETVSVTSNTINASGIYSNRPATAIAMVNNYVVRALIDENEIINSSSYGSFSTNYGIYCTEITPLAGAYYTVTANNISGLYNGVFIGGTKYSRVQANNIEIRPDYGGIYNFQQGIQASNSYATDIYDNAISTPTDNSSHNYDWAAHQHGILLDWSSNASVRCNVIEDFPVSMKAQGTCYTPAGDGFRGNESTDAGMGFWIDNYGEIGNQYLASTTPTVKYSADNKWSNPTLYTYSSWFSNQTQGPGIPFASKLYSRSTGSTNIPSGSCGIATGGLPLYGTNTAPHTSPVCAGPQRPLIINNAIDIADGSITYEDETDKRIKLSRRILYRNIKLDSIRVDTNDIYEDFMANEAADENGYYFDIEDHLMSIFSATSNAQYLSQYLDLINAIIEAPLSDEQDVAQRNFDALFLGQYGGKMEPDSLDIISFEEIANACPVEKGIAVLQARAYLWPITGLKYFNECELQGWDYESYERKADLLQLSSHPENYKDYVKVYPNPASNEILVDVGLISEASIKISDLTGRVILSSDLQQVSTIDLSSIANGVYIYHITSNGAALKSGKIIVNK